MMRGCYLLHFRQPLDPSTPNRARHYIGYATDIDKRIKQHRKGRGSRFCAVAHERGIEFDVVCTWPNMGRDFERALKAQKNAPRLCWCCKLQTADPGKHRGVME
ncbi:hypothetical protein XM38_012310 [Halomicronema hongdechloris C2206]|uniref:GIY-YIG domain-containing protein n=1 Tax=Halomicronema hongdechloris C2206 TaxID=1641165 RepID=A0A1Z3HIZ7_9CYAN|nr:hypothetical protein XM38_012310 [Halomicronema hongdechloris C2206]